MGWVECAPCGVFFGDPVTFIEGIPHCPDCDLAHSVDRCDCKELFE
jgi:hypothetical protein